MGRVKASAGSTGHLAMSKPDRKDKKGIQRKKSTDGGDSTSDGGTANYRPIIHKPGKKPGIKKLKKRAERTARTAKAQERRKAAELANTPENRRATLLTMAEKFERKAERAAKRAADYRQKAESLSGGANSGEGVDAVQSETASGSQEATVPSIQISGIKQSIEGGEDILEEGSPISPVLRDQYSLTDAEAIEEQLRETSRAATEQAALPPKSEDTENGKSLALQDSSPAFLLQAHHSKESGKSDRPSSLPTPIVIKATLEELQHEHNGECVESSTADRADDVAGTALEAKTETNEGIEPKQRVGKKDKKGRDKKGEQKRKREAVDDPAHKAGGSPGIEGDIPESKKRKKNKKKSKGKAGYDADASPSEISKDSKAMANTGEQWNVGALDGGSARQDKFLRLLGASKAGKGSAVASQPHRPAAMNHLDPRRVEGDLQKQHDAGWKLKYEGHGRKGLGA